MIDNDLIQVLWVEDDPSVTKTYPLKAEKLDLQLEPFQCWDDAKSALESDYDRWSAIILDAKCKQHYDSVDNAVRFLGEALKDIAAISKEKRRVIPWYILTGGAESEVSDSITDDRMKWDADWTKATNKKYYSKNVDNEMLFRRIRYYAKKSPRMQIQEMYSEFYDQLTHLNIDVREDIVIILEAMHFPDTHPDFNPKYFLNPLRIALEYIFRSLGTAEIIPEIFFKDGKVNINQCFMFAIGKDAEKLGYRHGDGGFAPRHIQDMMSLIINLGNSNSHSFHPSHSVELTEKEVCNYENYIKSVGGDSRLLIFSITLQFCEILQWMNNYIKMHPDKEENRKKWIILDTKDNTLENNVDFIGIVERDDNGNYHIADKCVLNGKLIEERGWLGKKVKVIGKDDNKNLETRDLYPYFAFKISPI